eukprot:13518110-Ditylum_brightwellii.AAC.1
MRSAILSILPPSPASLTPIDCTDIKHPYDHDAPVSKEHVSTPAPNVDVALAQKLLLEGHTESVTISDNKDCNWVCPLLEDYPP